MKGVTRIGGSHFYAGCYSKGTERRKWLISYQYYNPILGAVISTKSKEILRFLILEGALGLGSFDIQIFFLRFVFRDWIVGLGFSVSV